jgi:putative DNA primase/helicase
MDAAGISKIGQAALYYAGMGWHVIPLAENSKFPPKIKEWQHEATIDATIITQWWSQWPNANIGIATGEKSGIFVLDVDGPKHGTNEAKGIDGNESLKELLDDHGGSIPDTVEAITPTGGRHILFKYPDGVIIPNSSNSLGDGLDVKSTNGYMVAAPSIVPAGEYVWECSSRPDEVLAAECPEWLLFTITTEKPINTADRPHSFERRPTDGPAEYMLHNCAFMQHVQLNAKTLSYGEWLAALTNIVRATDGIEAAHAVSALDTARYNPKDCDKKIDECLGQMQPQNCEYIRTNLGFQGCPSGCNIKAPCGWSLGSVAQAKAKIRTIITPTPENVNNSEILGALALLQKKEPLVFDDFLQRYNGNKASLKRELSKSKIESAGFSVIDGGQAEGATTNPKTECWLSQTVPDVPVDLMLPCNSSNYSTWAFSNDGIRMKRIVNMQGQEIEKLDDVSYTPVIISERIYNIDNKQEKAKITFKTEFGDWRNVVTQKSNIFNTKNIVSLSNSGLNVTSETAKNLVKWLSTLEAKNAKIIPVKQGVSKMGWRNNETEFILPGIENKYTIDIGDSAAESTVSGLGQAGDYMTWLRVMFEVRKRNKARFILAASFAVPLLKIVGQRPFLIYNWDTTRGGKTATLHAGLSIWGKPEDTSKTFSDSKTNMERTASLYTDLPMGINEYELLSEKQKEEAQSLVYQIAEGKGRGRATREGLQETVQWRTIAIMNGESQFTKYNSRGGVFTRLIEIKGGPLADDDIFASSLYSLTARNYGHAGKTFIERLLSTDHEKLREIYNKTRKKLREKYPAKIESQLDAMSCIALADYLASMWIFSISEDVAAIESINMVEEIIKEITNKTEADESERAWDWLPDWLAANESRFMKVSDHKNKTVNSWLGYMDEEYISVIKSELDKALKVEGFNSSKVFTAWADAGRFPCTINKTSGKRQYGIKSKSINSTQPWLICIKKDRDENQESM